MGLEVLKDADGGIPSRPDSNQVRVQLSHIHPNTSNRKKRDSQNKTCIYLSPTETKEKLTSIVQSPAIANQPEGVPNRDLF